MAGAAVGVVEVVVEGACPEGLEAGDGLGVVVSELAGRAGAVLA